MRRLVVIFLPNLCGFLIERTKVPDLIREMYFYFCSVSEIPEYVPPSLWLRNSIPSPADAMHYSSKTAGNRKLPGLPVAKSTLLSSPTLRALPAQNTTKSYFACVCPGSVSHHLYRHTWLCGAETHLAWAERRRVEANRAAQQVCPSSPSASQAVPLEVRTTDLIQNTSFLSLLH